MADEPDTTDLEQDDEAASDTTESLGEDTDHLPDDVANGDVPDASRASGVHRGRPDRFD